MGLWLGGSAQLRAIGTFVLRSPLRLNGVAQGGRENYLDSKRTAGGGRRWGNGVLQE